MMSAMSVREIDRALRAGEPILPGWVLVPLRGGVPVVKWATIAAQTTADRAEFARRRHDAWAVLTGPSHLFVVDLDRGHQDGVDGVTTYADLIAPLKAPPVRCRTPRGGWHLYYAPPERNQTVTGVLPGIDVKGRAGMATFAGQGRVLAIRSWEFPPVPTALADILDHYAHKRAEAAVAALEASTRGHGDTWTSKRFNALAAVVADTPEGGRNAALVWAAHRGAEAVAAGVPEREVHDLLIAAAVMSGLDAREAGRTVAHIIRGVR